MLPIDGSAGFVLAIMIEVFSGMLSLESSTTGTWERASGNAERICVIAGEVFQVDVCEHPEVCRITWYRRVVSERWHQRKRPIA